MAYALRLPDWKNLLRTARPSSAPAKLGRRYIYILPTRYGLMYAVVLIGMLVGAINYTLSLGFVLTFLLAALGNVAMLHTWRNLANLTITTGRMEPVFVGEDARFELIATDHSGRPRYAIAAHIADQAPAYADIAAFGQAKLLLTRPAKRRGWQQAGKITFFTEFPLGLFHAWSYVELDCRCLVYPHPAMPGLAVPSASAEGSTGAAESTGGDDDFAGLRAYQFGDSSRRVDWKASSREQGLMTKQFQGEAKLSLWLDWQLTPGHNVEQRISQLTRWVIDAHAANHNYGLRLPGVELPPANNDGHYHACLEALAILDTK